MRSSRGDFMISLFSEKAFALAGACGIPGFCCRERSPGVEFQSRTGNPAQCVNGRRAVTT
ncbi:hypothetical protein U0070_007812 [Myodes glareolus]|uniref:Uncharacterized protein n=1 Tax=Myodes glareolus TaxID=447135 RepID=A0AAW0ILI3_MYOGA